MAGAEAVFDMEQCMHQEGFIDVENKKAPMMTLEKNLLTITPTSITQGVFYILPIVNVHMNRVYLRYFESGCYTGFLPKAIDILIQCMGIRRDRIFPWQVHTKRDIFLYNAANKSKTPGSKLYMKRVGSNDSKQQNKESIMNLLLHQKEHLDRHKCIVFIHKTKAKVDATSHR